MNYTDEQWNALCKLRLLHTPPRQRSASTLALKDVLLHGVEPSRAAETHGITRQAVSITLRKTREYQELARTLAEAPEV